MMDKVQRDLLETVAGIHDVPEGAYNIRANGKLGGRATTANINIVTKEDKPGIDIIIRPGTVHESVHIPVIISESGLKDMVYNDFYIGENSDVVIVAGCGIHNCGDQSSRHDGIHTFYVGKNARVKYIEKHYGENDPDAVGSNVMNPTTVVYVEEGGYNENQDQFRDKVCSLVDICGEFGIYCIVDWHILTPGNPLDSTYAGAEEFFRFMANKYADKPHVLFEICNEPNNCMEKGNPEKPWECTKETDVTWDMIAEYANTIIPAIHNEYDAINAPHPVIIVGTPQWDQLVDACLKVGMCQGNGKDLCDSLPPRDARLQYDNVMYAFHFYSGEHNEGFEKDGKPDFYNMYSYMYDVLGKLPVFCSEFGLTNADGNGDLDYDRTDKWLLLLSGNNAGNQLVSFCNWSYSDNERSSSALNPGACAAKNWNDVTPSGDYIKKVLSVVNGSATDTSVLKDSNLYSK